MENILTTCNLHVYAQVNVYIHRSSSRITKILIIDHPLHDTDQHPQKDKHVHIHVHVNHYMCEVLYTVQSTFCICVLVHLLTENQDADRTRIFNPIL